MVVELAEKAVEVRPVGDLAETVEIWQGGVSEEELETTATTHLAVRPAGDLADQSSLAVVLELVTDLSGRD